MYLPIILSCIVAVLGKPHHNVASHGHHHFSHHGQTSNTDAVISPHIVGGSEAEPTDYPWQAVLMIGTQFFCGGSLIRPHANGQYYVLTAAHCVDGVKAGRLNVGFGQYRSGSPAQTVGVSNIIMHEDYNSYTLDNDIALLILNTVPNYEEAAIGEVQLPADGSQSDNDLEGRVVTVTGFGTTSSGGSLSNVLQAVTKPYVKDNICADAYRTAYFNSNTMLCAGDMVDGGVDACQGDSGGPLVYNPNPASTNPSQYIQYGVVSWGYGCADRDHPGVYADVPYFLKWIKNNTQ